MPYLCSTVLGSHTTRDVSKITDSLRARPESGPAPHRCRKTVIAPKVLFLANGARDKGIDMESVKKFVTDLRPSCAANPERLKFLEEPMARHAVTDRRGAMAFSGFPPSGGKTLQPAR